MTKHSQISVSTCNINVLHHKTIDDKTTNQHFVNSIKHHDFIFLTETWSDAATVISDFKAICTRTATSKSKRSCHRSGGITLFVKNEYQNMVTIANQILFGAKYIKLLPIMSRMFIFVEYIFHL